MLTLRLANVDKECRGCGEFKSLDEFYHHPSTYDYRFTKCIECCRTAALKNRWDNIDTHRERDRGRPHRSLPETQKRYREEYPKKRHAHHLINNQIRDGKRVKEPCEVCGDVVRVHAHHDDYDQPDVVRWLCAVHHFAWHREHGEALNPK